MLLHINVLNTRTLYPYVESACLLVAQGEEVTWNAECVGKGGMYVKVISQKLLRKDGA
jgi:hypothetical protein